MNPLLSTWLALLLLLGLVFPPFARAQTTETPTFADPAGRFTVPVPTSWQAEVQSGAVLLRDPEGEIRVFVLSVEAPDATQGVAAAWAIVEPGFGLRETVANLPPPPGVEQMVAASYDTGDPARLVQALGQQVQGRTYAVLLDGRTDAFARRSSQVNVIASGLHIAAQQRESLVGVSPNPLTPELIAELEAYTRQALADNDVPGASVAIVEGGQVVYEGGFGVREQGGSAPVTPETLMMIGSTTKTMTTMMMASLVDEGRLQWNTPVVDILPSFALADPEYTQRLTVADLVCACTGVPRRDLQLFFETRPRTAEDVIASLRTFTLFTPPGEAFQYSNQMVATGGFIATLAAGGRYGHLSEDYVAQMQERVFGPIGMPSTTFSFDQVRQSPNVATPHGQYLDGSYRLMPLHEEEFWTPPIAPAGAAWSNASDMARYLVTQVHDGVAPDGTRVVSAENLQVTRTPRVAISSDTSYGLGWIVGEYKGLRLLQHGGNTLGFTSDFAFLPEVDLGIVVLSNARASNVFNESVRNRLFELIYDQPMEFDAQAAFARETSQEAFAEVQRRVQPLDLEAVMPYLGTFRNDELGDITLSIHERDGTLVFATPDFSTELWAVRDDQGNLRYVTSGPPLAGVPFEFTTDEAGTPIVVLSTPPDVYRFLPVTFK